MSRYTRSRRREYRDYPFERRGDRYLARSSDSWYDPDLSLPPAQERVHRYSSPDDVFPWDDRPAGDLSGRKPSPDFVSRPTYGSVVYPAGKPRLLLPAKPFLTLNQLRMEMPRRVRFCVQRKQRREVLFSRGVAGRSGGSPGPYFRRDTSQYSC